MAGPITVLLVDEDPEVLDLTATFLARADGQFTVKTESEPTKAVDRVANESIDCVVSDYRMPGMDGLELNEAIQQDIPFFLLSAAVDPDLEAAGQDAGVTDVIQKDSTTDLYDELATDIRDAVEQ